MKSRKFWLAVVGAGVAFCNSYFDWGLKTEEVWAILTPLLGFIAVEGTADTLERMKK